TGDSIWRAIDKTILFGCVFLILQFVLFFIQMAVGLARNASLPPMFEYVFFFPASLIPRVGFWAPAANTLIWTCLFFLYQVLRQKGHIDPAASYPRRMVIILSTAFIVLILAVITSLPRFEDSLATEKVNTPAPEYEFIEAGGKLMKSSDFAGKVVVLDF